MTHITKDERVKPIIRRLRNKEITKLQARNEIRSLTLEDTNGEGDLPKGRTISEPAFLDWEIEEAVREAQETT